MILVQLIRSFYKMMKSAGTPHEVALGFVIGMLGGLIGIGDPRNAMYVVAVLMALVFVRCAFMAGVAGLLLWKSVYLLGLYRVTYAIGFGVLETDNSLVRGTVAALDETPVVALFRLGVHNNAGGVLLWAFLSVPVYLGVRVGVRAARERFLERLEKSRLWNAVVSFPAVRGLRWLLVG